jgi:drug/metabolite transporter (DMT)-like permease
LSLLLFFIFKEKIGNISFLLLIAFLNAITFFSSVITRFEALKRIGISIFYPINRTGTLFLMIIISYLFLNQPLTPLQIVGLLITILAIYLLTLNKEKNIKKYIKIGLLLTFASTLFAALGNFTLEFVKGTFSFTFLSYGLGFIFSYLLGRIQKNAEVSNTSSFKNKGFTNIYSLGILIGVLNFTGLVFFIEALKTGPFSIVGAVSNFSLLITLSLGLIIYKERPTKNQIFGTILSFLALILFKL